MRIFLLTIGSLSLALGIVGIFLPVLPTTPFLLLAAVCFSRASPRLHRWLLTHPRLGPAIVAWQTRRVISLQAKLLATALMVPTVVFVFVSEGRPLWLRVGLLALISGVMLFIWTKKSR